MHVEHFVWQSEQNQSEDNVLLQEPHITLSLEADNWGEDGGEGKKFMMEMLNERIKESKEICIKEKEESDKEQMCWAKQQVFIQQDHYKETWFRVL